MTAPPGTQASSLNIEWAYHNSPIAPHHKPYLAISWEGSIYNGHIAIEGLATASGIQGCPADLLLDILCHHGIEHVFKWVDDVVIFHTPCLSIDHPCNTPIYYSFNLSSIFGITGPLGVPWHPIYKKGQDFASSLKYVGFHLDLECLRVSFPEKKHLKLLLKLDLFLSTATSLLMHQDCASIHGSLQHITFVFRKGHSTFPPPSSFISKFGNNFSHCHTPHSIIECAKWWKLFLSSLGGSHSLVPCHSMDPDIWVDASSSWGIGIVVGKHWSAWCLLSGWDDADRDI